MSASVYMGIEQVRQITKMNFINDDVGVVRVVRYGVGIVKCRVGLED
jgi:hypothetical protein